MLENPEMYYMYSMKQHLNVSRFKAGNLSNYCYYRDAIWVRLVDNSNISYYCAGPTTCMRQRWFVYLRFPPFPPFADPAAFLLEPDTGAAPVGALSSMALQAL